MDTSLVELDIFFLEILYVFGKEIQHVRLAVIGLLSQYLEGERTFAAVALQGTFADLEQHAQVLVVEKPHALGKGRLLFLRLHGKQQLVLAVKPFEDFLHPALEILSGKQFHDLFPPSVCFSVASRAERMVPADAVQCAVSLRHRVFRNEAVYLREEVHTFSAERGVPDAVPVAHPLQGTPADAQYPGGLG